MYWETPKVCVTGFTAVFALLRWPGTAPAASLRFASVGLRSFRISWHVVKRKRKCQILVDLPEEPA